MSWQVRVMVVFSNHNLVNGACIMRVLLVEDDLTTSRAVLVADTLTVASSGKSRRVWSQHAAKSALRSLLGPAVLVCPPAVLSVVGEQLARPSPRAARAARVRCFMN